MVVKQFQFLIVMVFLGYLLTHFLDVLLYVAGYVLVHGQILLKSYQMFLGAILEAQKLLLVFMFKFCGHSHFLAQISYRRISSVRGIGIMGVGGMHGQLFV